MFDQAYAPLDVIDPTRWQKTTMDKFKGVPVPKQEWLVPDLLPVGYVSLLHGSKGIGKTDAAVQLMAACALGRSWFGLPAIQCRSVGLLMDRDILAPVAGFRHGST